MNKKELDTHWHFDPAYLKRVASGLGTYIVDYSHFDFKLAGIKAMPPEEREEYMKKIVEMDKRFKENSNLSKSDDLDKLMILEDTIENLMKDGPNRK